MFPANTIILIVEDSKITRDFLIDLLKNLGFEDMTFADNGINAIKKLEQMTAEGRTAELILSDINMPEMNGLEFVKNVKKNPHWEDIPIIMSTAEGELSTVLEAVSLGINEYIVKPVTIDVVKEKLKKVWTKLHNI